MRGDPAVLEDEKDEDGTSLFMGGVASVQPVDTEPERESTIERRLSDT